MRLRVTGKNKIMMVLYYYHPYVSGVSVSAKRVAEGLADSGYEVTVLTSRYDKKLPKQELIRGVRVVRRPVLLSINKGVIMPTFWFDIIRGALKNDYVNPHLPLAESGFSSLFIPKRKIVTTYQCDINLGSGLLNKLVARVSMGLMRMQLHRSRVVVPSTRDYLSHSKMKKFIPKAKPIYPMVTANEFHPVNSTRLFTKLGVGNADKKIGFVGRIVYEKGIEYLLGSIPHLDKRLGNFKIIIVGDYKNVAGGSTKDQLDGFMKTYPDKIIFTGFLSDKERNEFYSGLDVFVLPSIDPLEAYGMVQVEAMLCGAPVIATNLPGVREILNKTGYGKICKIRNSKDIALQIYEVVTNSKKYKPVRSVVARIFDPQNSIDDYSAIMPVDGKV